ncbi:MAG: tripartite tricarboxylate transporter substrate binding protein [Bacillota bacterium]
MSRRLTLRVVACFVLLAGILLSACTPKESEAPAYPSKGLEFVVPFAAGGAVDLTSRILCTEVEKTLGQKFTIANKPTGGAVEGLSYVARAAADGYTLGAATSSLVTNILTKDVDFTLDSYDPIAMYSFDPMVFVVNADSPWESLDEVVEASKTQSLAASTPGLANSKHIAGMLFEQESGAKFTYVHTGGASEGVPMLAGGHVQVGCWSWGEVKAMVDAGKLRVLGVMSEERDERIPDVPTFKEQGYDLVYGAWRGIAAPKGLPDDVKATLTKAFGDAIQNPDVVKQLKDAGFPVLYKDAEGFWDFVKADYDYVKAILETLED